MTIEERLGVLEKSVRHYRILVIGLVLALAASVWAGPLLVSCVRAGGKGKDIEKTIRCQKLEVVDDHGKTRAVLEVDSDGTPSLNFYDTQEKVRAGIEVTKLGSAIFLFGDQGEKQAQLQVNKDWPALFISDARGEKRAILGLDEGNPFLTLFDAQKKERVKIVVSGEGSALGLLDAQEKIRAFMAVDKKTPALELYDGQGKIIFQKP
ncbi:MAG: hypothetical protein PHE84_01805 [bacterium]|nr:hypothetical protein [bacterium]